MKEFQQLIEGVDQFRSSVERFFDLLTSHAAALVTGNGSHHHYLLQSVTTLRLLSEASLGVLLPGKLQSWADLWAESPSGPPFPSMRCGVDGVLPSTPLDTSSNEAHHAVVIVQPSDDKDEKRSSSASSQHRVAPQPLDGHVACELLLNVVLEELAGLFKDLSHFASVPSIPVPTTTLSRNEQFVVTMSQQQEEDAGDVGEDVTVAQGHHDVARMRMAVKEGPWNAPPLLLPPVVVVQDTIREIQRSSRSSLLLVQSHYADPLRRGGDRTEPQEVVRSNG